jgi:hypothetical protein
MVKGSKAMRGSRRGNPNDMSMTTASAGALPRSVISTCAVDPYTVTPSQPGAR